MTMIEATKACFSKYFQFSGRARRAEYWWFYLFTVLVSVALGFVDALIIGAPLASSLEGFDVLSSVWSLVTIIPSSSAAARRLHDTDRTGWWQLLVLLPMLTLFLPYVRFSDATANPTVLIVGAVGMVIGAILLLVWLASRGTQGPNRFGPDPLRPQNLGDVFA
jgi:uncharacterized membrane protein YhaH (DUF805 family)